MNQLQALFWFMEVIENLWIIGVCVACAVVALLVWRRF